MDDRIAQYLRGRPKLTRERRRELKRLARTWGEWEERPIPPEYTRRLGFTRGLLNNRYSVQIRPVVVDDWGEIAHLQIARHDGSEIDGWDDLNRIRRELYPGHTAIEVYPTDDKLVDQAAARHLWVLPAGVELPFGLHLWKEGT